ncbi:hypothetical protein [Gordonia hydrophobica]|uniref:Uncharacterized protein n=1 Tax=Gordonia hydrophobica TaxID=40516 RepID=A0ABZ2U090_9ACTN|nr:hypothetical protein [Gordonia hydrophobica]MBM7366254.1 cytoskeletal protein RodZ [Gordonia hydrophobica]
MNTEPTPRDDQESEVPERSALLTLAHRMRHIYKTRVRTTTVVLIVAFLGLWVLYSFTSQHYSPDENTTVTKVQQTRQPSTTYQEPTTEEPQTTDETPTSTDTGTPQTGVETTEPSQSSTPPNVFEQRIPTAETTIEQTQTPGSSNRP